MKQKTLQNFENNYTQLYETLIKLQKLHKTLQHLAQLRKAAGELTLHSTWNPAPWGTVVWSLHAQHLYVAFSFDYYNPVSKRQTNKKDAPTAASPKNVDVKNGNAAAQTADQISDDYYDDYYNYPAADKRSDSEESDGGFFDQAAQIVIAEKLPK